jgi:hypothetical protein
VAIEKARIPEDCRFIAKSTFRKDPRYAPSDVTAWKWNVSPRHAPQRVPTGKSFATSAPQKEQHRIDLGESRWRHASHSIEAGTSFGNGSSHRWQRGGNTKSNSDCFPISQAPAEKNDRHKCWMRNGKTAMSDFSIPPPNSHER